MPRYFFDLYDTEQDIDHDGIMLPGPDEARTAAIVYTGDLIRDRPSLLPLGGTVQIRVHDENRAILLTVTVTIDDLSRSR